MFTQHTHTQGGRVQTLECLILSISDWRPSPTLHDGMRQAAPLTSNSCPLRLRRGRRMWSWTCWRSPGSSARSTRRSTSPRFADSFCSGSALGKYSWRLTIIAKTTLYLKHLINSYEFWATNSSSSQGTQAPGLGWEMYQRSSTVLNERKHFKDKYSHFWNCSVRPSNSSNTCLTGASKPEKQDICSSEFRRRLFYNV